MYTAGIYGNGEYSEKIIVVDVQKGITNERKCLLVEIWNTIADLLWSVLMNIPSWENEKLPGEFTAIAIKR
jgi:hypothetical protein